MDKQWDEWIEIVDAGPEAVDLALSGVSENLSILVASALSVAKWHPCRKEVGGNSWGDCGLCRLFFYSYSFEEEHCYKCPLKKVGECCRSDNSIFTRWENEWFEEKETEEVEDLELEFYKVLMDIYREAYNEYMGIK